MPPINPDIEYLDTIDGVRIVRGKSPICEWMEVAMGYTGDGWGYWQAYDNTIWCVDGVGIPPWYVIEHEKVHFRQQNEYPGGLAIWWDRYLTDTDFRADQEAEAYMVDIRAGFHTRDSVVAGMNTSLYGFVAPEKAHAALDKYWGDDVPGS